MKLAYKFLGGAWFASISINFLSSTYDRFRFKNISFKCKPHFQTTELTFSLERTSGVYLWSVIRLFIKFSPQTETSLSGLPGAMFVLRVHSSGFAWHKYSRRSIESNKIMKHTYFDCVTSLLAFKTQNWKKFLKTYIREWDTTGKTTVCNKYLTVVPLSSVKTKQNQNY